jgi:hypothetical protein
VQPKRYRNDAISNNLIVVTAVLCVFGLILLVGIATLANHLMKRPTEIAAAEAEAEIEEVIESGPPMQRVEFQEGYFIMLPAGFKQESREVTEKDYIVYRFRTEQGYRFTFAIIPDETSDRYSTPPNTYSDALVKSVPELSQDTAGVTQPRRVMADVMRASLFHFYEKETYRGVNFTYYLVAMDEGKRLALKISGKYGGYREDDPDIIPPDHWRDSLLTLGRIRAPKPE